MACACKGGWLTQGWLFSIFLELECVRCLASTCYLYLEHGHATGSISVGERGRESAIRGVVLIRYYQFHVMPCFELERRTCHNTCLQHHHVFRRAACSYGTAPQCSCPQNRIKQPVYPSLNSPLRPFPNHIQSEMIRWGMSRTRPCLMVLTRTSMNKKSRARKMMKDENRVQGKGGKRVGNVLEKVIDERGAERRKVVDHDISASQP